MFLDATGSTNRAMQTIAREMNFSETTFIMPAERQDTDIRMRIFTPGVELPMAGHPTIGSTFALADMGVILPRREHFVFGLGVGPTRVELTWEGPASCRLRGWISGCLTSVSRRSDRADHARGRRRSGGPSRAPGCPIEEI